MKHSQFLIIATAILVSSCSKDVEMPQPVDVKPPAQSFSLSYVNSSTTSGQFELLVTDSTSVLLLDTLLATEMMHNLTVYSPQNNFNLTTIVEYTSSQGHGVQSFYQVRPKDWKINQFELAGFEDPAAAQNQVQGKINYQNLPNNISLSNLQMGNANGYSYDAANNSLQLSYFSKLPYESTILFPDSHLYNYYIANSAQETVNVSHLDMALAHTFQKTLPAMNTFRSLSIFTRKDDVSSRIKFYDSYIQTGIPTEDLLYPAAIAKQFLVLYSVFDANTAYFTAQFGDALSSSIDFKDSSYYQLDSTSIDHYTIAFLKENPSCYSLIFYSPDNVNWTYNLPAEKKDFTIQEKLTDLSKSKMLKGWNSSQMKFRTLSVTYADKMNYHNYFNYILARDATGKNKFKSYQVYSRNR